MATRRPLVLVGGIPAELPTSDILGGIDNARIASVVFDLDGNGSVLTTGTKLKARQPFDFACTIVGWALECDPSGSVVVDLWKDTAANYPPTIADTITASAKPTVSSGLRATSSTLTGWTTAVAAGDVILPNLDSVTSCTWVKLTLKVVRT